ncbi:MAG: hypothetical protein AAFX78_18455 [Cyanobacteria bacterium J06638_20]
MKKMSAIANFVRKIFNNAEITGAITVISCIGYLLGDAIARTLFLILALCFGFSFLRKKYRTILSSLRKLVIFLTWKFFAGAVLGLSLGMTLFPIVIPPLIDTILSTVAPEIIVTGTRPLDDHFINVNDRITVRFSDPLPWPYSRLLKIEISPKYKIRYSMFLNWLSIDPDQPYEGYRGDRYEFDSHYTITVSVLGLIDPFMINFCTPKEGTILDPYSNKTCN